ncbi:MAG: sigma-54-dependent Fis family transcriptional regulator [Rhodobacteraceae bacterium]|nr:sigma-54-dependent Fis family transcriptional regulator [Paracoccaceae bacterium]
MNDTRQTCFNGNFQDYDDSLTRDAWERFLDGSGRTGGDQMGVRSEILESWFRCSEAGISAEADMAPLAGGGDEIHRLKHDSSDLRAAASDVFARLAPLLENAGVMLILTDKQGTIIETLGDPATLDAGRRIHLEVGGIWNEEVIGTNGIGTPLRTGKPAHVHASEHFCSGIKNWTCVGAPIRDPFDGSIIGLVDLSGPPGIFRPHNTALLIASAQGIEAALAEFQKREHLRLIDASRELLRPANSGDSLVVLDRLGRVVDCRVGDRRAVPPSQHLEIGRRLLRLTDGMDDNAIAAALPGELKPAGIRGLRLDGSLRGAALLLPDQRRGRASSESAGIQIRPRAGTSEEPITILGRDPGLLKAIELAQRAAEAGASILVQGETGVGKELFARLVHDVRQRKAPAPYVAVNCGAISSELVGSELFGHSPGAFTGASREGKAGKFELANGGVICLDEIGEMPLEIQPYLLRVLEQRAVYRIGESRRRPIDVQLVALTNRDLRDAIAGGRFRSDLYYRISTISIAVPPLRARRGDIPILVRHFFDLFAKRMRVAPIKPPDDLLRLMDAYAWPGNVRELRNMTERLMLLSQDGEIRAEDYPTELTGIRSGHAATLVEGEAEVQPGPSPTSLEAMECSAILEAIEREQGNMTRVAACLGISRPTLYRKMRLYGIRRSYG